jgi:dUTP pyrophosphatase
MTVKIVLEKGADTPKFQTTGSAGADLHAFIKEPITLKPGEQVMIPTGIKLDMTDEKGLCAWIVPRSSTGKAGLVLGNTVGLIDNDYQGELSIIALNRNPAAVKVGMGQVQGDSITIEPGMRIAQLVFMPFVQPDLKSVKAVEKASERGEGGFGSTGK